jgi:hypothetical protein
MQIEDLKRWHWALIGLVLGLAFSYVWQDHDVVGDRYYQLGEIKQRVFEREAQSKSGESGQPILQNVRVEPPVHDYQGEIRQIVVGQRLRFDPKNQKEVLVPFYYYASVPYKPMIPAPGESSLPKDAAVLDYLAAAKTRNPALRYRFAWELQDNWFTSLWAVGGLVVVGGIWPTILNLLLGMGFGRPRKSAEAKSDAEYLSRFGKGKKVPPKVSAPTGPTEEDRAQLDQMNQSMEAQLAAAGVFATQPAAPVETAEPKLATSAPAVVQLSATPAAPRPEERQPGETEEEFRKRFAGGEFYPVSRGPRKE